MGSAAEQLPRRSPSDLDIDLATLQSGPDARVELLPIGSEQPSAPPRESRPSRPRASNPEPHAAAKPVKLGRSEIAVYALAALVVVISVIAMALLMQT